MTTSLSNSPVKLLIGIDPGTHTGIAVLNPKTKSLLLRTLMIHQAFNEVDELLKCKFNIEVVIEDPNLWTHFSGDDKKARERLQGAGSVKRDYSAWRDFLKDRGVSFTALRPDKTRNRLATDPALFKQITGYADRCSEHARVAAMLIWR